MLAACVLAVTAAPQSQPRPHAPAPAAKAAPAAPSRPRLSDAQLEAAIRAKFARSKSASAFTVKVQGGVAHIDGATNVVQHKAAATRMARTAGAVTVDNRVQVSDAAKQRAAGNLAEGRRRAQVKRGAERDSSR
ncbi:MAG: BON domain-containing protein [Acidobacteriota bacterium]|nr:BON domain-containing protein [Acidobacteriota bacterium]